MLGFLFCQFFKTQIDIKKKKKKNQLNADLEFRGKKKNFLSTHVKYCLQNRTILYYHYPLYIIIFFSFFFFLNSKSAFN